LLAEAEAQRLRDEEDAWEEAWLAAQDAKSQGEEGSGLTAESERPQQEEAWEEAWLAAEAKRKGSGFGIEANREAAHGLREGEKPAAKLHIDGSGDLQTANPSPASNGANRGVGGDPFSAAYVVKNVNNNVGGSLSGEEGIPVVNGQVFSPRDVRRAAAVGTFDILIEYMKVRPSWGCKQDSNGWTAWHLAARSGHSEIIQVLQSTDPGCAMVKANDGRSPLGEMQKNCCSLPWL